MKMERKVGKGARGRTEKEGKRGKGAIAFIPYLA